MVSSPNGTGNTVFYAPRSAASTPGWDGTTLYDTYDLSPLNDGVMQDIPLLPNRQGPRSIRQGKKRPSYIPLQHSTYYDHTIPAFDAAKLYSQPSSSATDVSFLKTPSPSFYPNIRVARRTRRHPFSSSFEPPEWKYILIHLILCIVAYPALMIFTLIARRKTLFWTRFVVSCGCGVIGFCLGISLLHLSKAYLEAATWATLIHQSRTKDAPGIRLRDFAEASQDPMSAWTALRLLWSRMMYPGTARKQRATYDRRPWSLYIIFFLTVIMVAASLPFLLGRIVAIDTNVTHQYLNYHEFLVKGDLSETDIANAQALQGAFNDYTLTWTLSPFSTHGGLPPAIAFPWENDMVYFSETIRSQLLPNGTGFGTFDVNTTAPTIDVESSSQLHNNDPSKATEPGTLIRYPRWGIRIHCKKLPETDNTIITRSPLNFTYMFTPRSVLQDLFTSFNEDFPAALSAPLNITKILAPNDTLPNGFNVDNFAMGALYYDNGVAHSFFSKPITMGQEGYGFVTLESVLVRLNTSYTPNGKFLRLSDLSVPDKNGTATHIGYDGAVCLELYEPWVVETYNSTFGSPSSTKIVSKSNEVRNVINNERNTGTRISGAKSQLNSSALLPVYDVAHGNSANQMLKDNGRDAFYVPSPTVVSFTSGQGPKGYTELSDTYFAQARALADASNVLPYFAGTGTLLARSYPDMVLSDARIDPVLMVVFLVVVLLLGLVTGLCVPKLPLGVPRRGFELYSWLAAFQGEEVVSELHRAGVEKNMELKEIQERLGDLRFRYAF